MPTHTQTIRPVRIRSYRLHKPPGQAVVTLGGRDFYLGPWKGPESRQAYKRLVAEYLAGGGRTRPATDGPRSVQELVASCQA